MSILGGFMQIGFGGLLFVLFLGLQLAGYISWPWIWVCAPLWVPLATAIVIIGIIGLIAVLCNTTTNKALSRG
jgi:hypothetical protein